jgi:hypothetical protein
MRTGASSNRLAARPRLRHLVLGLGIIATPACCGDPKFPVIWTHHDLTAAEVVDTFGSREPSLSRTGTLRELSADPVSRELLAEVKLLPQTEQLPAAMRVTLLAWETRCWGRRDEVFVGVFDAANGRVLTVGDAPLTFSRVRISATGCGLTPPALCANTERAAQRCVEADKAGAGTAVAGFAA